MDPVDADARCPDENRLLAYGDGSASDEDRAELERHLDGCLECRRLVFLLSPDPGETEPGGGSTLGRYEVIREIGRGGMGVVYAARDPELDRELAIKALHPRKAGGTWHRRALAREAGTMAKLSHANIVQVFDVDTQGERIFIAMELVVGTTLRRWVTQRKPWPEVQRVLLAAADGIIAAHDAGIIHRDVKPGNVLVGEDGRVAVSDFGLAGWISPDGAELRTTGTEAPSSDDPDEPATRQTFRGAGTPAYMAPEQHRGAAADARADIFAFCTMAYELVYGTLPFAAGSGRAVEKAKSEGAFEVPLRDDAPPWVRAVLHKGLAADPESRWPSMRVLRDRLAHPPRPPWLIGAGVTVTLGAFAVLAWQSAPSACEGGDRLQSAWTTGRDAIALQFEGDPDVTGIQPRLVEATERYVAEWTAAWHATCHAELSAGEAEERRACLEPGRQAAVALWGSLSEPLPDLRYRLESATAALPSVSACTGAATAPEALDPATLRRRADVHGRLARAIVLMDLGLDGQSAALIEGLDTEAEALGDGRVQAAVLLQRATLAFNAGKHEEVAAPASKAYALAGEHDDDAVARGAALQAARAYTLLGALEDAERWTRYATAAQARLPPPGPRPWELPRVELMLHHRRGDLDAAKEAGERAVRAVRTHTGNDAWATATTFNDLANILLLRRETETAHVILAEGVSILTEAYGAQHPQLAVLKATLGLAKFRAGEFDAAESAMREADAIWSKTMAPHEGNRLLMQLNLGSIALAREDFAGGRDTLLPVLEGIRETQGRSAAGYDATLTNVGIAELELGMLELARRRFDEVLEIRTERSGGDTPGVAEAHNHLGLVSLAEGKLDDAQAGFSRAAAIWEHAKHPSLSSALVGLGDVAAARGDGETAREQFERSLALRKSGGYSPARIAEVQAKLDELAAN
ncbi:MAG: protein kinase [Myxococcota bacterium]